MKMPVQKPSMELRNHMYKGKVCARGQVDFWLAIDTWILLSVLRSVNYTGFIHNCLKN